MDVKTWTFTTDGSGGFTTTRPFVGVILGIKISGDALGDAYGIEISDAERPERDYLNVGGLSGDAWYQPMVMGQNPDGSDVSSNGGHVHPAVIGSLTLTISGATPNAAGAVRFVLL